MGMNGQIQLGAWPLTNPNVAVPPFTGTPDELGELVEAQALSASATAPIAAVSPSRPRLVLLRVARRLLGD
jgi:hypothetical protein